MTFPFNKSHNKCGFCHKGIDISGPFKTVGKIRLHVECFESEKMQRYIFERDEGLRTADANFKVKRLKPMNKSNLPTI